MFVGIASAALNWWHGERTMHFRRMAQVPLPNAYASSAEVAAATDDYKYLFNCAQRAETNYAQNQTSFLVVLMISGVCYPRLSAGLGAAWLVGRTMYAVGYTTEGTKEGKGKDIGLWWIVPHIALVATSLLTAWNGVR